MTGTSSAPCSIRPSLVAQRFDGIEPRSTPRWIEGGEERERQRHDYDGGGLADIDLGRQLREEIKLGREQFGVGEPGQELPDRFDVEADEEPDTETDQRSDHADGGARDQK